MIPAYNEEERLEIMLEEALEFLDAEYGRSPKAITNTTKREKKGAGKKGGYEIILVNDGSKDKTVQVALEFSRKNKLHDIMRICTLEENRGKGGAVTHGFRHVRGEYAVFADADGASRFRDLKKLVEGCRKVVDGPKRGIAVGSRAHLVGSEAVVKVCLPFPFPLLEPNHRKSYLLTLWIALSNPQRSNALFPRPPPYPYSPSHLPYPRHPMWIQTLLSGISPPYNPLHAR